MFNGLHYNSIATYLKERFGGRVVKLPIDAGLTCPNRDGTCGYGGCSFCTEDGSGTFAGKNVREQTADLTAKWPDAEKYIAYFQSHTNTYAPVERLRELWDDALSFPGVEGIAIATRPDCLGEDVLDLLSEYNERTFLWVELGLQTENEKTAEEFNRGYKNAAFTKAMMDLSAREIKCVTHLIFGLRGEDKEQMLRSAVYAASFRPFGIKIHMLNIIKGTRLGKEYLEEPFDLLSESEYVDAVVSALELLPPEITIHRLTGDAPGELLISPEWVRNKHTVLNDIQKEFKRRGSFQGARAAD